jgi:hypothetical protein
MYMVMPPGQKAPVATSAGQHGRILKLIRGMIMLALAVTLVVAPDTMHSLGGTLTVFGGAIGAAALILWLHRRVLPRFGIVIGSEALEVEAVPALAGAGPEEEAPHRR